MKLYPHALGWRFDTISDDLQHVLHAPNSFKFHLLMSQPHQTRQHQMKPHQKEGSLWVDYDDQPKLELEAVSESALRMIGYDGVLEFEVDPGTGVASHFVIDSDKGSMEFIRRAADPVE